MATFFWKLIPPRPTFAQDMSEAEAHLMQEHASYWQAWRATGHVVAFGLVADPKGAYGIGIAEFETEAEVQAFRAGEPTLRANVGFRLEAYPMPRGVVHG